MMASPEEQSSAYISPASSTDTVGGSRDGGSWPGQLSNSFSAIAEQLLSASRAMAQANRSVPPEIAPEWAALVARLDQIEQAQAMLKSDIDALREGRANGAPNIEAGRTTPTAAAPTVEELEKRVNEMMEEMKLDQARLYARLHNARATVSKMPILAPPTTGGKPPPNFPATRGEFEHVTKERYEALLKAYGQPAKGDTNAKREALRTFIGLAG